MVTMTAINCSSQYILHHTFISWGNLLKINTVPEGSWLPDYDVNESPQSIINPVK